MAYTGKYKMKGIISDAVAVSKREWLGKLSFLLNSE